MNAAPPNVTEASPSADERASRRRWTSAQGESTTHAVAAMISDPQTPPSWSASMRRTGYQ